MTKVAVSACLLGVACRFDGKAKPSSAVQRFLADNGYEPVPVCPEAAAGLSIPRPPCEIIDESAASANERACGQARVVDCKGVDRTAAFQAGAHKELERVAAQQCKAAILKSKSPSCGLGRIYDGTFTGTLSEGDGVFARQLKQAGVFCCTEEDIALGKSPLG